VVYLISLCAKVLIRPRPLPSQFTIFSLLLYKLCTSDIIVKYTENEMDALVIHQPDTKYLQVIKCTQRPTQAAAGNKFHTHNVCSFCQMSETGHSLFNYLKTRMEFLEIFSSVQTLITVVLSVTDIDAGAILATIQITQR
jgi:hypothetical protein